VKVCVSARCFPAGPAFSRWSAILAVTLFLAACTTAGQYLEETAARPDPLAKATDADLNARSSTGGGFLSGFGFGRSDKRKGAAYFGSDVKLTTAERKSLDRLGSEEFEVNLENADVAVAARSVLGDVMGISYTLDPRATGTVSIVTSRPMPAGELLQMFETALRSNGIAMMRESDRLRLIPASEALGVAELDQSLDIKPGYGVTVLPLRHVSADTILPLLENFVARQGMVREDPGRNALIFQGTAAERIAAIEAARSFDQDWLASESVGIFPVQNSNATSMMAELNRVLDLGEGGRGRKVIRLQPIERSNSILVVAKSRALLQKAGTWIQRLDANDAGSSNLRVYRVQHGDAKRLAAMVNEIFSGSSASTVIDDPTAQFPPESGSIMSQDGSNSQQPAQTSVGDRMADNAPVDPGTAVGATVTPVSPSTTQGGEVRITANVENNSLLILAPAHQQKMIDQAIAALDRPSAQVAIEATIAEVTLTNDLRYGVQVFLKSKDLGLGDDDGSIGLFKDAGEAVLSKVLPGFNLLLGPEADPRVVIDALRGVTEVKILSSPSVVVMDNKAATLQVGDEIPIVTRTAQSVTNPDAPVVNNVEFRNTGVILNVLPKITANGTINLVIEQEISSVSRSQAQSLTPTISQRRITSTVSVASGQTVMLGGLISERQQKGRDGIPVLGDLPVIGDAFRSNSNNATRTELIIMIKPQVIRDSMDAQQVAEEMRAQLQLMNQPSRNVPLPRPKKTIIE